MKCGHYSCMLVSYELRPQDFFAKIAGGLRLMLATETAMVVAVLAGYG